ncbi:MAG TPA: adenosylcobinamide-phosphate synthase CbiB [Candidatus Baltobacteraceae bacterium]
MDAPLRLSARTLLVAYVADLLIGDPVWIPHPVRAIGALIEVGERSARRARLRDPRDELLAGALVWCAVVGSTYAATHAVLRVARRFNRQAGVIATIVLSQATLATRNLLDEVHQVETALNEGDLARARVALARIVGRDTADLDESEIARAAIETLAESLCDGIIAPLCALAVGGVPAAMVFKSMSTMDSMLGHIEPPYTFFGRVAARADDLANYLPARLTAALIVAAAAMRGHGGQALEIWLRDGARHPSPNAGQCEAAMAGALGVRLGGLNRYNGAKCERPHLAAEFRRPLGTDIAAAREIVLAVSIAGALFAALARCARR